MKVFIHKTALSIEAIYTSITTVIMNSQYKIKYSSDINNHCHCNVRPVSYHIMTARYKLRRTRSFEHAIIRIHN